MPSGSGRAPRRQAGEAGYNLVVLTMAIMLLEVLIAATLPMWSALIRRDKEEETISRGLQYAEAIRVFQRRFGRLPNRLQELVEVEPRSIRRLWKDPLTADGAWGVIVQLPQGGSIAIDPETGLPIDPVAPIAPPPGSGGPTPTPTPGPGGPRPGASLPTNPDGTPQPVNGPIRGVRSRAKGDAFQSFFGNETYESWEFTVDLLLKATSQPGAAGMPRWNAMTIGRPYRFPPMVGQGPIPGVGPVPKPPAAPPGGPGPRPRPGGGSGGGSGVVPGGRG